MTHNPQSDDEIIAEDRRRYRRRMQETLVPALTLFGMLLLLAAAEHFHLLATIGVSHGFVVTVERYFPFAILVVTVPALFRNWPRKEARSERILRKQIDIYSARWRWVTIMFLIALPLIADNAVEEAAHLRHAMSWAYLFQLATFLFIVLSLASIVGFGFGFGFGFARKSYREALSDELTRAMRARTIRFGYLALMVMASATYLVILYRLAPATTVLPALLAAGVAVPMIHYLVLEWRTGRSDG